MKKIIQLILNLIIVLMSIAISSCDKEKDETKSVPSEAQIFIGGWELQNNYFSSIVFYPDGTCIASGDSIVGRWTYDKDAKTLATTRLKSGGEGIQLLNITFVSDDYWTGMTVDGTLCTAERNNGYVASNILGNRNEGSNWKNNNYTLYFDMARMYSPDVEFRTDDPEIGSENNLFSMHMDKNMSVTSSQVNGSCTILDGWGNDVKTIFEGSVTISNYNNENAKLLLEGTANGKKFKKEYVKISK